MKRMKLIIPIGSLALCFLALSWWPAASKTQGFCLEFAVPAVTHGFQTSPRQPSGDLFLLPQPALFTVVQAPGSGASLFGVGSATFGGSVTAIGGFPGTSLQGLALSPPNSSLKALSCLDSFWDVDFEIASTCTTSGDTIRLFLQNPDGSGVKTLALFTLQSGGVVVSSLFPGVTLHVNDRLATGAGSIGVGSFVPFATPAGAAGRRTDLLTLALTPGLMVCQQLGIEINRDGGNCTTSIVVLDVVVTRRELPNDRSRPGTGLIEGLGGGFPTGLLCDVICPSCPLPRPKCDTICFSSPDFYLSTGRIPNALVLIGGVNLNRPIHTQSNLALILQTLQGNIFPGLPPKTPLDRLNRAFLAAQLSLARAGGAGSPVAFNALWGSLGCYEITFAPVVLSNGVVISTNSMLMDLFHQAELAILENRTADMNAIAAIFELLAFCIC
jgi:hypothetical protein